MQAWEYLVAEVRHGKVIRVNNAEVGSTGVEGTEGEALASFLNRNGTDGWELVTLSASGTGSSFRKGMSSEDIVCVLKRPKP
jgi:regulation of enolase protein 1 (concanavalin A-like superfamily)